MRETNPVKEQQNQISFNIESVESSILLILYFQEVKT